MEFNWRDQNRGIASVEIRKSVERNLEPMVNLSFLVATLLTLGGFREYSRFVPYVLANFCVLNASNF
jgi:hypothetical protein